MKALRKNAHSFHAEVDKRSGAIASKRKKLISLVRAAQADGKAIDAVVSEISGLQEGIQRLIVAHLLAGKDSMNTEQREKFFDLLAEAVSKKGGYTECPPSE